MKVIAILEVDEEKLKETGNSIEDEMKRVEKSGIVMKKCHQMEEYEYCMFAWNKESEEYEPVCRPMSSGTLCRNRFNEMVDGGYAPLHFDCKDTILKKRLTTTMTSDWETAEAI